VRQEEYYIPDIPMPQDFVPNYDMTNDTGAGYVPNFQYAMEEKLGTMAQTGMSSEEYDKLLKDQQWYEETGRGLREREDLRNKEAYERNFKEGYQEFPLLMKSADPRENAMKTLMSETLPLTPQMQWTIEHTPFSNEEGKGYFNPGRWWSGDLGKVNVGMDSENAALHEYAHAFSFQNFDEKIMDQFNKEFEEFSANQSNPQADPYVQARMTAVNDITNNKDYDDAHRYSPIERYSELITGLNGDISKLPPNLRRFYEPMLMNYKPDIPRWENNFRSTSSFSSYFGDVKGAPPVDAPYLKRDDMDSILALIERTPDVLNHLSELAITDKQRQSIIEEWNARHEQGRTTWR
jgi:hypothetical protein